MTDAEFDKLVTDDIEESLTTCKRMINSIDEGDDIEKTVDYIGAATRVFIPIILSQQAAIKELKERLTALEINNVAELEARAKLGEN